MGGGRSGAAGGNGDDALRPALGTRERLGFRGPHAGQATGPVGSSVQLNRTSAHGRNETRSHQPAGYYGYPPGARWMNRRAGRCDKSSPIERDSDPQRRRRTAGARASATIATRGQVPPRNLPISGPASLIEPQEASAEAVECIVFLKSARANYVSATCYKHLKPEVRPRCGGEPAVLRRARSAPMGDEVHGVGVGIRPP